MTTLHLLQLMHERNTTVVIPTPITFGAHEPQAMTPTGAVHSRSSLRATTPPPVSCTTT